MNVATSKQVSTLPQTDPWLLEHGPGELESLMRAVIYNAALPILIADDDRKYREANARAGKLLGGTRARIVGKKLEDFAESEFRPKVSEIWKAFLEKGEQNGTFQLQDARGQAQAVQYTAKGNVLPVRHLLVLHEKISGLAKESPWALEYALLLLNADGVVAAWYSGAERIYGFTSTEIIGRHTSLLYELKQTTGAVQLPDDLARCLAAGHFGTECWQVKKDGSRFWANLITIALKDQAGQLRGFARVVRNFSGRERKQSVVSPFGLLKTGTRIAGVASGEFDHVPEMNDALLDMLGYTREDLLSGELHWPDLSPPECAVADELAHEEGLRFGACVPYEKILIRKDKTRIAVLISTAVLSIVPFRWLTFVQDLRHRDQFEKVEQDEVEPQHLFEGMVGDSPALKRVQRQIEVVAPTDANVLILGETGTGKELVARAIHRISPRRNLPFVTLNCAAIPTGLLESELFGYERGAFTGALTQKIGRFEMAHKGTLFLDEVGDIPLELQPKLLRALQEKSFERLGGTRTIPIDVRLVAATNRDLTQMMGDKLFRSDLYYRLKVFPITTPPLRDHPEDIPLLARFFTKKYSGKMERQVRVIPTDTMRALVTWPWPGNVRELENFMERSVILSSGNSLRAPLSEIQAKDAPNLGGLTLEQVEREHIVEALRECNGVVTKAAARLGLHRTTLNAMMKKLGIHRRDV